MVGCADKGPRGSLAITRIDNQRRMEVVLIDPEEVRDQEQNPAAVPQIAAFSLEPYWRPDRRELALTRIDVTNNRLRVLSLYAPASKELRDIAAMGVAEWSGYRFSPAWHPSGRAIAFKLFSERRRGVFAAILANQQVLQLLPDPARQIDQLAWGERHLFFSVHPEGQPDGLREIQWVELPTIDSLAGVDATSVARTAKNLGPGFLPRVHNGSVYYVRSIGSAKFEIVRDDLSGNGPEVVVPVVGPYFAIARDGTIAYQSDPLGTGKPVRLTFLEPGSKEPKLTSVSAFQFRFSPDGRRVAGLWVSAGVPRYFVYDRRSEQAFDVAVLRGDLSADALVSLVDSHLFDW